MSYFPVSYGLNYERIILWLEMGGIMHETHGSHDQEQEGKCCLQP